MVEWRPIETYPGGKALFWCKCSWVGDYAVFGEVWQAPEDNEPRVWDDGDRGFAPLSEITHWAACQPPTLPTALH